MKHLLFIFFILTITQHLFAQTDSPILDYVELDSISMAYYEQGDYKNAIAYLEVAQRRAASDFGEVDSTYAHYISNLGACFIQNGNLIKAEKLLLEANQIHKKIFGDSKPIYLKTKRNWLLWGIVLGLCTSVGFIYIRRKKSQLAGARK